MSMGGDEGTWGAERPRTGRQSNRGSTAGIRIAHADLVPEWANAATHVRYITGDDGCVMAAKAPKTKGIIRDFHLDP